MQLDGLVVLLNSHVSSQKSWFGYSANQWTFSEQFLWRYCFVSTKLHHHKAEKEWDKKE